MVEDTHYYNSIMGFPVTGQGYNIVAFSFYIGEKHPVTISGFNSP